MVIQNAVKKPLEIKIVTIGEDGKETEGMPTIIEDMKLLDSIVSNTVVVAMMMNNQATSKNLSTQYYVSLSNGMNFLKPREYNKTQGDYK